MTLPPTPNLSVPPKKKKYKKMTRWYLPYGKLFLQVVQFIVISLVNLQLMCLKHLVSSTNEINKFPKCAYIHIYIVIKLLCVPRSYWVILYYSYYICMIHLSPWIWPFMLSNNSHKYIYVNYNKYIKYLIMDINQSLY